MAIESALIKPVVDAIMALLRRGENVQLHRNAEKAVREAIRELLLATPDENKAAGLLSEDVVLAEEMLQKHRATKAATRTRSGSSRARKKPAANEASTSTSPPGRAKPAGKAAAKPEKKPAGKTGPARKTKP